MFNEKNGYSLSDIAVATRGDNGGLFGGNNAGIELILFLLLFCGIGGGGFWGNRGLETQTAITNGFDMNSLQNGIRGIQNGLCDGFYAQNTTMLQGFNTLNNLVNNNSAAIEHTLCQGFNGTNVGILNATNTLQKDLNDNNVWAMQNANSLQRAIENCCCDTRSAIAQVRYDMATDTCAINNAIVNNARDIIESQNTNTRLLLDEIRQNKMDAMQGRIDELMAKNQRLESAADRCEQNAYLLSQFKPCPVPAYNVPSPYCCNGSFC